MIEHQAGTFKELREGRCPTRPEGARSRCASRCAGVLSQGLRICSTSGRERDRGVTGPREARSDVTLESLLLEHGLIRFSQQLVNRVRPPGLVACHPDACRELVAA